MVLFQVVRTLRSWTHSPMKSSTASFIYGTTRRVVEIYCEGDAEGSNPVDVRPLDAQPKRRAPTLVDIVWRDVQKAYNIHKPVLSLDCTQRNLGGPFNANCIAVERYHNEGILECLMSRRFKPLTNPTHSSTQSKEGQGLTQSKARELSDQYQSLKEQELWREQKRLRIANNRSKRKAQRSYAHPRSRLQLQRERTKAAEGSADDRGF